jgi:hypothetical protein
VFFLPPSPGLSNHQSSAYLGFLEPPLFSHESGIYSNGFNLSISSSSENGLIYYSTDGTDPNPNGLNGIVWSYVNSYPELPNTSSFSFLNKMSYSYLYDSSIFITNQFGNNFFSTISTTNQQSPDYLKSATSSLNKCKIIKAKIFKLGYIPSDAACRSYFFGLNTVQNIPIFSIQVNPVEFWGYSNGINVAGKDFVTWRINNPSLPPFDDINNFNRETKVDANLFYFENINEKFDNRVQLKIHGGYTRTFRLKSLTVYNKDQQNNGFFASDFFKSDDNSSLSSFYLRNSGNDFINTYFKDAAVNILCSKINCETMRYRPSNIYMNGEYWGILNVRDRIDNDFLAEKYQIPKDSIEIGKNGIVENSSGDYESLVSFVKNTPMTESNNFIEFKNRINYNSFLDFVISTAFFGNWDALNNNYLHWKAKGSISRQNWKWIIYDFDNAFTNDVFQVFYNNRGSDFFYKFVKNNAEFKVDFVNRFSDLMNSHFVSDRVVSVLDSLKENLAPEINNQIQRWKQPQSYAHWEASIGSLITFANQRNQFVITKILTEFAIAGTYDLTVRSADLTQGYIKVNSIEILNSTPGIPSNPTIWAGQYFDNIPLRIVAKAQVGHKFTHWVFNGQTLTDSAIVINTGDNVSYEAFFEEQIVSESPIPVAYDMEACSYIFTNWPSNSLAGSTPRNMKFVYFSNEDPGVASNIGGFTNGGFGSTSRTRIIGNNLKGFSFINTGSSAQEGYVASKLGGALLAFETTNLDSLKISWKGRTLQANPRKYAIRLQYRVGDIQNFSDFSPVVEYPGGSIVGDSTTLYDIHLPSEALNKPYVQLLWRYYYTGIGADGSRDELGVDDIEILAVKKRSSPMTNLTEMFQNPAYYYFSGKVEGNSKIESYAQKAFFLQPGFIVETGAVFEAQLKVCNHED